MWSPFEEGVIKGSSLNQRIAKSLQKGNLVVLCKLISFYVIQPLKTLVPHIHVLMTKSFVHGGLLRVTAIGPSAQARFPDPVSS